MKIRNEQTSPVFSQNSTNVLHNLNLKVNFSYRIGKMNTDNAPRKSRKSVTNDDLKGGEGGGSQEAGSSNGGPPASGGTSAGNASNGVRPGSGMPIGSRRPTGVTTPAPGT